MIQTARIEARSARVHTGVLTGVSARVAIHVDTHLWPNRRSYTGQPLVELHLPGSPPLLEAVLSEVYRARRVVGRLGQENSRYVHSSGRKTGPVAGRSGARCD